MTLTRNVNGVDVILSAAEEAQVRAEWAAIPVPGIFSPQATVQDVINVLSPTQQSQIATAMLTRGT